MSVSGNITTVAILDANLEARFPTLDTYFPTGVEIWTIQIAEGKKDAETAFRVSKSQVPDRALAIDDNDWKRILVFFTLAVITRGLAPAEDWVAQSEDWRERAYNALSEFLYQYDDDDDGEIDEGNPAEDTQSVRDIQLRR